jgi:hypothetical protein
MERQGWITTGTEALTLEGVMFFTIPTSGVRLASDGVRLASDYGEEFRD